MPLTFPTSGFFQSSGNAAAEFQENLRDAIVDFSCNLWSNFPGFISAGTNPVSSFGRGYMSSICRNRVTLPGLPPPPFTGGQCEGVLYNLNYREQAYNIGNCNLVTDQFSNVQVTGPVGQPFFQPSGTTAQTSCNGLSNDNVDLGSWRVPTQAGDVVLAGGVFSDPSGVASPPLSSVTEITLTRIDGLPDDCGDPRREYDSPDPTGDDLETTITINSPDGDSVNLNLIYNKITNEYNFPMGFKLDGVNISLGFSGLTFYGDTNFFAPGGGNDPPPPGSDGGNNGVDGDYTQVFIDQTYPTLPDFAVPQTKEETIDTLICEDGVINIIQEVIKAAPGSSSLLQIILGTVNSILEEICTEQAPAPLVGYPEYYGLKPGAGRPAIVYLYKTWDGSNYGASTYSSTVNEPSSSAVAEIETVAIPDKTIGTFIASITLLGGTRLRASGTTKLNAISNLNFLIGKVNTGILPPDLNDNIVVTEDTRLQEVDLVCRQIEYYPQGAAANRSATVVRVIDQ